ncbi:MAG: helix-turn-helix transcriptional regulator [Cytophagales bacterium]|nr:helix-turn-helix transcriptional regulator [Cytophagales bacterium]
MEHLYVVSAGLTGFFLFVLGGKPRKARHDWFLVGWLALVLFHLLVAYRSVAHPYTPWLEVSSAGVFAHGPLLYAYALALTQPAFRPRGKWLLHLLPALLNLALVAPALLAGRLAPLPPTGRDLLAFAKLGSILTYCLLVLRVRRCHLHRAADSLSALESVQLRWVQYLVYGVLGVWTTGLATQVLRQFIAIPVPQEDLLVNAAVAGAVTAIGYYGFRQTTVFIALPRLQPPAPDDPRPEGLPVAETPPSPILASVPAERPGPKYDRSGLDLARSRQYAERLTQCMAEEKPFTEPELSLDDLAGRLSLSPNQLSQVINAQLGKNFWDFVNEYRIREVEAQFRRGVHHKQTLLAIALDAGFNSKASFNRAFKKFTGQTPSEYLKGLEG